jgi:DNA (cytosine-5)-methyltransferase 1
MNYLSVCSGIEAATVAWHDMGWNPLAFSEIEKFPSEVLAHHYPKVPNLGDMTKFKEWDLGTNRLDLLVGGTPCQSFSVAGLRKGLDDPRGNLALTYVGILDKFRPKWCVWENVPGVLSSGSGRDFGSFLGALVKLGYGFSYRVLDAQYFGVPQRRRRVFVVGCIGSWESAAKVLFESESLSGNIAKGRGKGKEIAKCITTRLRNDNETETFLATPAFWNGSQTAETLTRTSDDQRMPDKNRFQAVIQEKQIVGALCARDYKGIGNQYVEEGKCIVQAVGFDAYNSSVTGNVSKTLDTGSDYHHVPNVYSPTMAVRRLTEVECERLQGFPDNYTNIKENCPSGARYKSLGNSMAVPVMKWIGQRIQQVENGQI